MTTELPPADFDMPPTGQRPSKVRWLVFAMACGTSWLLYLHRYTWNFIAPKLQEDYGWSIGDVQWAYSMFMWTYGIGQIPSGMLCDLLGPHLLLGAIIIAWSLIVPLHAVPSKWGMGGVRLLFGAAQAGGYPVLAKITRAWFPNSYRTIIQGWVATVSGRTGGALSPIIMATVLMGYCGFSWQMALVLLSSVGIVFAILFLLLFKNSPDVDPRVNAAERLHIRGTEPASAAFGRVMPWGQALRNRSMVFFIIMQMFIAGVDTIYSSLMGVYFLSRGIDIKAAGLLASLPLWGGTVGGLLGAILNDRLRAGRRWPIITLGAGMGAVLAACVRGLPFLDRSSAAGMGLPAAVLSVLLFAAGGAVLGVLGMSLLLPAVGSQRWGRSSVGMFSNIMACGMMLIMIQQQEIVGAAIGLFTVKYFADMSQPTQWGACTDIGGRDFSATVFAIVNTAGNIGGIVFPIVFGLLLQYNTTLLDGLNGSQAVTNFRPMFLFAAGMYITGAICWAFIDCTRSLDQGQV